LPWTPWRARREARAELERAGVIETTGLRRSPRVIDKEAAAQPFQRLLGGIRANEFQRPRDRELILLAAWSGVLRDRLSKEERRLATRRLPDLAQTPRWGENRPVPADGQPEWDEMAALRAIVALGGAQVLVESALSDLRGPEAGASDIGGVGSWDNEN
jgi:hypothetical protein